MKRFAFLSIAVAVLLAAPAAAQDGPGRRLMHSKAPARFDISPPLRDIVPIRPPRGPNREVPEFEPPKGTYNRYIDVPEFMAAEAPHVVQTWQGEGLMHEFRGPRRRHERLHGERGST